MKWIIFLSGGKMDDPFEEQFEAEADSFSEALQIARRRMDDRPMLGLDIDGIVRTDLLPIAEYHT